MWPATISGIWRPREKLGQARRCLKMMHAPRICCGPHFENLGVHVSSTSSSVLGFELEQRLGRIGTPIREQDCRRNMAKDYRPRLGIGIHHGNNYRCAMLRKKNKNTKHNKRRKQRKTTTKYQSMCPSSSSYIHIHHHHHHHHHHQYSSCPSETRSQHSR
jgi:hypothetical protein